MCNLSPDQVLVGFNVHVTVHRAKFLTIKPTGCTNFSNLFWNRTLHVSDSFSVHHQESSTVHTAMVLIYLLTYLFIYFSLNSRDSLLGVMTCYKLETQGSNSGRIKQCFSSRNRPIRLWVSATFLFNGYRPAIQGINRPGCDVGHSAPVSADVQNKCSYTTALSMCLHSADRVNFTVLYMSH